MMLPITSSVHQGAIWSYLLFILYIRRLLLVSLIVGYADDHAYSLSRLLVTHETIFRH